MTEREKRFTKLLPVRVFGMGNNQRPFSLTASTVDISRHGTCLSGIALWDRPGEIVGVRYEMEKARYRVVWIEGRGPGSEPRIGLYCVDPGSYIWDVLPPKSETAIEEDTSSLKSSLLCLPEEPRGENRRLRDRCTAGGGGALVAQTGAKSGQWALLYDLNSQGCYLETRIPEHRGTNVNVLLRILGLEIQVKGEVTSSDPQVGMGIAFREITPLNRKRLDHVMGVLNMSSGEVSEIVVG